MNSSHHREELESFGYGRGINPEDGNGIIGLSVKNGAQLSILGGKLKQVES